MPLFFTLFPSPLGQSQSICAVLIYSHPMHTTAFADFHLDAVVAAAAESKSYLGEYLFTIFCHSLFLYLSLHQSFLYFSFNSRSSSTASETFFSLILLMSSQLLSFCLPLAPLPLRHSQHQQRKRALLLIVLMRQFKVIILMSWQAWLSGWPALLGPERCSSSRFSGHSHCHWRFPFSLVCWRQWTALQLSHPRIWRDSFTFVSI